MFLAAQSTECKGLTTGGWERKIGGSAANLEEICHDYRFLRDVLDFDTTLVMPQGWFCARAQPRLLITPPALMRISDERLRLYAA
jgi:hypothetical protein